MWHGVYLGKTANALAATLEMQQKFTLAYMAAGAPIGMAMFSNAGYSEESAVHEVTIYFSPDAADFAKTIQGSAPCDRPSRAGLGMLMGDARSWAILYPE